MPGMAVAQMLWRNAKITRTTRTIEMTRLISTSWTDARMVMVRSCATVRLIGGRNRSAQQGQHGFHAIHRVNDVRRRLAEQVQLNHRLSVDQSGVEDIHLAIDHGGHIGQTNRRVIVVGNNQRAHIPRREKAGHWNSAKCCGLDPTKNPWANAHWRR